MVLVHVEGKELLVSIPDDRTIFQEGLWLY